MKIVEVNSFLGFLKRLASLEEHQLVTHIGDMPMILGTKEDSDAAKLLIYAFENLEIDRTQELLDALVSCLFLLHLWGRIIEAEERKAAKGDAEHGG